jgi:hypothetical protein
MEQFKQVSLTWFRAAAAAAIALYLAGETNLKVLGTAALRWLPRSSTQVARYISPRVWTWFKLTVCSKREAKALIPNGVGASFFMPKNYSRSYQ